MPNFGFVPLIAGGSDPFGGLAAQGQYWAAFNQRQDEDNARRLAASEDARNNYLARVAQMQREDARTQDAFAIQDLKDATWNSIASRRDAEAQRQFDIGTKLAQDRLQVERERFGAVNQKEKTARDEQNRITENLANNLAPDVFDAGQALEDARLGHYNAGSYLVQRGAEWQSKMPAAANVVYNSRTNEFESARRGMPIPEQYRAQVDEANKDLAKARADYMQAQDTLNARQKEFSLIQNHAYQNGLVINKDYSIYSPVLNRSFSKKMNGQKVSAGPTVEDLSAGSEIAARGQPMKMDDMSGTGNYTGPWQPPEGFQLQTQTGGQDEPGFQVVSPTEGAPADLVYNPGTGALVPKTATATMQQPAVTAPPAAIAPLRQEGFVPVIPTSQNTPPLEPLQIKSVPPTNPTWTPEGFRGINGALLDQREINPDYSQPFSYNSPDDIINLYYAGRMPKQYALASLKANFPDLPQNRLLQIANGPEWYNPGPTPRRVRWDPGSPNNRGGFVYDTGKSQWE